MRDKKILSNKPVQVGDLLELIGQKELETLSESLQADKWVPKLKAPIVFQLALYSVLEDERLSLRIMEENYKSPVFKAMVQKGEVSDYTAHSSISDRLKTIKVSYFQKLYEKVYRDAAKLYGEKALKYYNIKRYDSTMIAVFSHLMEGMKVGNTSRKKNQVKITTELTNDFEIRVSFFKDQNHLGEEVALKEMIQSQSHSLKDLIVFDRGIKSRITFCEFKKDQTLFTTRLNDKNRYKFVRKHGDVPQSDTQGKLNYIQDSIVYLYTDGNKLVKEEFRLIEVQHKKTGKKIYFLTNILDLSADLVAEIYRRRWEIEVFFRFLKQEMNLTHFVSNDLNAIQVMLYTTLIAATLVLVYKKKNDIHSYKIAKKRFTKDLEANIILEMIQTPEGLEFYKLCLKHQVEKQYTMNKKSRKRKHAPPNEINTD